MAWKMSESECHVKMKKKNNEPIQEKWPSYQKTNLYLKEEENYVCN